MKTATDLLSISQSAHRRRSLLHAPHTSRISRGIHATLLNNPPRLPLRASLATGLPVAFMPRGPLLYPASHNGVNV